MLAYYLVSLATAWAMISTTILHISAPTHRRGEYMVATVRTSSDLPRMGEFRPVQLGVSKSTPFVRCSG